MVLPALLTAAAASSAAAGSGGILGTLGSIGGALGGAGQFLGGLGGLFGGGDSMSPKTQINYAVDEQRQKITNWWNRTMTMADKWGIHPLTALGVSPAVGGSSFSIGGGSGAGNFSDSMAQMGQGLTRASAALSTPEDRQWELMQRGLQMENNQLQNERLRAEISLMRAQSNPPLPSFYQEATGPLGEKVKVPSQFWSNLMENDPAYIPIWHGKDAAQPLSHGWLAIKSVLKSMMNSLEKGYSPDLLRR